jgi:hypothetical protein
VMQNQKNITALFFLGVFAILLMHQVMPHGHHEHNVALTHEELANGEALSHHHKVLGTEHSEKGFLDLFLNSHVHSVVFNEILLSNSSNIKQTEFKKDISTPLLVVHYLSFKNDDSKKTEVYHPPNHYCNAHFSSFDSRGPPV